MAVARKIATNSPEFLNYSLLEPGTPYFWVSCQNTDEVWGERVDALDNLVGSLAEDNFLRSFVSEVNKKVSTYPNMPIPREAYAFSKTYNPWSSDHPVGEGGNSGPYEVNSSKVSVQGGELLMVCFSREGISAFFAFKIQYGRAIYQNIKLASHWVGTMGEPQEKIPVKDSLPRGFTGVIPVDDELLAGEFQP